VTGDQVAFRTGSIWIGVHDALSARMAARAGAPGIWLSSFGVSASLKASPDNSLLFASEMMEVARQCCFAAESTPVIVDCDTGYGDAGSVAFVARQYIDSTTVTAICIEDKVFPKRNAMDDVRSQGLEPPEVLEAKIAAARSARGSTVRPLLIARTEALVFHAGVEEAVQRLVRYAAAGADALLVQSTAPLDYLLLAGLRAKQATGLPMVAVPTSFPNEPATTFWNAGFDVVVRSHQLLQAAVAAQTAVLGPLLDGSVRPRDLPVQLTDHAHLNVRRL